MTSDQYYVLISKIREVCFELKETQKCLNMQTEAIEKIQKYKRRFYQN